MESQLELEQQIYRIGIVKRIDSDVVFSEVKQDATVIDRMFITSPYRTQLDAPQSLESFIINEYDTFWKDIIEVVENTSKEANSKRQHLFWIMKENPYLPLHKFVGPYMYSSYFLLLGSFTHIPVFSCCLTVVVFLLTGHAFILIFFLCFVIACLLDLLSCRLFFSRGSEEEREWLSMTMEKYPELNTLEIDEEISRRLSLLSFFVMDKYPQLEVKFSKKICKHDAIRRHVYFENQFILHVKSRVHSVGQWKILESERRYTLPFQVV
jgi:hypothetical protein